VKEILSAFGSEIFRPLATIVIPGALTVAPYFIWFRVNHPSLNDIAKANVAETTLILVGLALFFGMVLDGLGSHIEDGWDQKRDSNHGHNWYRYLRFAFTVEPVGHRYLKTLVLKLKFELGSYLALLLALPATVALTRSATAPREAIAITAVFAFLMLWLRHEAHCSHVALGRLRLNLLDGIQDASTGVPQFVNRRAKDESRLRVTFTAVIFACGSTLAFLGMLFCPTFVELVHQLGDSQRGLQYEAPVTVLVLFCSFWTIVIGEWGWRREEEQKWLAAASAITGAIIFACTLIRLWTLREVS
jgi:hypothetical protein